VGDALDFFPLFYKRFETGQHVGVQGMLGGPAAVGAGSPSKWSIHVWVWVIVSHLLSLGRVVDQQSGVDVGSFILEGSSR